MAADLIDRVRTEQALRESDRRKTDFLALLAHELRNPLAPISNGVQVLRRAGSDPQAAAAATEMMERQISQLVRLVDDLLDVNRISRGRISLKKEPVDVAAVVRQAIEASKSLVQRMHHRLDVSWPDRTTYVYADPTRLVQVVTNLLNNACKFTPEGGHIAVAAEHDGREAVISVRDNGLGIPAVDLPRIFEMFAQVDTSLERSQGGLGLGLTMVRSLVELHGGTVSAQSDGPGRGSRFEVRLPVHVHAPAESRGPAKTDAARPLARRVLVVDDNHDAAESLRMLLSLTGNDVCVAYDGLEAVDAAAAFNPHVVLLDIGLPKLNGYDAARRIREQPGGRARVLVALTGWGQEESRQRSKDAGFDRHMVKPVDYDALMQLLGEVETSPSDDSKDLARPAEP